MPESHSTDYRQMIADLCAKIVGETVETISIPPTFNTYDAYEKGAKDAITEACKIADIARADVTERGERIESIVAEIAELRRHTGEALITANATIAEQALKLSGQVNIIDDQDRRLTGQRREINDQRQEIGKLHARLDVELADAAKLAEDRLSVIRSQSIEIERLKRQRDSSKAETRDLLDRMKGNLQIEAMSAEIRRLNHSDKTLRATIAKTKARIKKLTRAIRAIDKQLYAALIVAGEQGAAREPVPVDPTAMDAARQQIKPGSEAETPGYRSRVVTAEELADTVKSLCQPFAGANESRIERTARIGKIKDAIRGVVGPDVNFEIIEVREGSIK